MGTIVAPIFPEPVRVPGNVADAGHRAAIRYTRVVATWYVLSLGVVAGAIRFWLLPSVEQWVATTLDMEVVYALAILSLAALSLTRQANLALQVAAWLVSVFLVALPVALWGALVHDIFPLFIDTFLAGFLTIALGLVVYLWVAGRDQSLLGAFMVLWPLVCGLMIAMTVGTSLAFSEGLTLTVALTAMLLYWVYDLGMILRRRRPEEVLAGVIDLYRDVFNVIGFPIRFARMPKTIRRIPAPW